jgi:hypothetical protein
VGGDSRIGVKALVGKNLTEMTVAEVQSYMKGFRLRKNGPFIPPGVNAAQTGVGGKTKAVPNGSFGFLATGKYQIIPVTLYGAVKNTGLDADNTMYDEKTQETLGVYLLFDKRPILGAYLLGKDIDVEEAAQQAALEWASIPLQYSRPNGCQRGYSAYCKGGANATSKLKRTPEFIVQLLEATRQEIQNAASFDPDVAKIVNGEESTTAVAQVSSTVPDPEGLPASNLPPDEDPVNWENNSSTLDEGESVFT